MSQLVLSLFPGIGLLDMAFERAGFSVAQSRDWIFGGDVRSVRYPAGRFDGVIGGPPCQAFSRLAHMVRHNGYEPKFGNLIPEFERIVRESAPRWFLMEEVPDAPRPCIEGYENHEFTLNNRQCFDESGKPATQNRVRAITFGYRGERRPLMIETAALHAAQYDYAACGGAGNREIPVRVGGSGKRKGTLNKCVQNNCKGAAAAAAICERQGLPLSFIEDSPFRVSDLCKMLGNGVPLPMGAALANAVMEATQ